MKRRFLAPLALLTVLGGPLASPTVLAQDTVGRYIDDATITARVKARFVEDAKVNALRINVETKRGIVQLSGFATSEDEKTRAAEIARSVPDVREVDNAILIRRGEESGRESERSREPSR